MKNNIIERKTNLYIFLIIISFSQIMLESLNLQQLTSILFYISFIVLLYLWIAYREKTEKPYDAIIIVLAILCTVNVIIGILINGGSFSIGTVKKILFFISCLVIYRVSLGKFDADRLSKWSGFCALICSFFFIILFFTNKSLMFTRSGVGISQYLTLNLENPNKASLFIVVILITNCVGFFSKKGVLKKALYLTAICFFVFFLIQTKSRGGELTILAFGVTILLFLRKKKVRIPKIINFLFAIFPFLFALIYLGVIDSVAASGKLDFLISEGKGLDSRVAIWEKAFSVIKTHWVTGGYSLFIFEDSGLYQMHNTHIDVFVTFGISVFIMYIKFLYDILCDLSKNIESELESFYYYLAFAFTIVLGMSEAAAVNGANGLPILTAVFIAMCRNCNKT